MKLEPEEARALLAYIETLERPFGLDMFRKYGLGLAQASETVTASLVLKHPSVGAALQKLKDLGRDDG